MSYNYTPIHKLFKHVGYHPGRYLHIVDVTSRTVDFDYSEKERVDQLVIGSAEPLNESALRNICRDKLMEEHPDFQFYREVEIASLDVVEAFDREMTEGQQE